MAYTPERVDHYDHDTNDPEVVQAYMEGFLHTVDPNKGRHRFDEEPDVYVPNEEDEFLPDEWL